MNIMDILNQVDNHEEEFVKIRRDFHKYAETAWTEFRTTSKIVKFLQKRGIPVMYGPDVVNPRYTWSYPSPEVLEFHKQRAVSQGADPELIEQMKGYTGAMAVIDSGNPGPTYAFRFDIDCNDLDETKDEGHRPNKEGFASVNEHCMHACGHDGHATMGMILAAVLYENRALLKGKIKVIFQPGEEGDKGAQSVVENGVLSDVEAIFGMHIYGTQGEYPALAGTIQGLFATTKFDVNIIGKAAHAGAAPEAGNNAILAGVMAVSAMQTFMQDGRGCSRLNVGTIRGGTGRNVIPDNCFFSAETRGADTDVEKRLYSAAERCVKTAAEAYECSYDIKIMGYGPQGDGDEDMAQEIVEATGIVEDLKEWKTVHHNTGATDDFSYMMQCLQEKGKKACYMALFTRISGSLHNGHYDFDECCLKAGVKSCLAVVNHLMKL